MLPLGRTYHNYMKPQVKEIQMTEAVLETETAERQVGLRLSQAYFGFAMGLALVFGFVCSPHMFAYDISMVRVLVLMAGGMVTLWLMSQRARSARWIGAATALLFAGLAAIDHAAFGALDTLAIYIGQPITTAIMYAKYTGAVAVAAYLLFAPSAKRILCEPPDLAPGAIDGHSWDKPLRERVRTKVFWRDLMIYFVVFSMLGHWAEMLFCYNIYLGVFMGDVDFSEVMLWHQWLFPYFAEGVAVVLIVVLLTPVKEWLLTKFGGRVLPAVLASIVITAAVCTTIDFTCGMICNQNYEVWDYRALPFNFMGQVCLQNSTVYTVAASLILWIFYPLMDRGLRRMPRSFADGLFFALLGVYAFSALLHFMYVGDAGLIVGDFVMKPE